MSNYCKCGGYLGSGGIDGYAGRWCQCVNPEVDNRPVVTTTEIHLDFDDINLAPETMPLHPHQKEAMIEAEQANEAIMDYNEGDGKLDLENLEMRNKAVSDSWNKTFESLQNEIIDLKYNLAVSQRDNKRLKVRCQKYKQANDELTKLVKEGCEVISDDVAELEAYKRAHSELVFEKHNLIEAVKKAAKYSGLFRTSKEYKEVKPLLEDTGHHP